MKKLFYTLFLLLLFSQTSFSQNVTWGPWNPVSCWKGLHFHLSKGDYNATAQKYMWYCQFKNDYSQPISFQFAILSPDEVSSYLAGTWSPNTLGRSGRMTLTAGEDQSADPKDYFGNQPGTSALFTSGTKLFVAITNVRFGNDDQSRPYATDECGHPSGKSSSAPVNDGGDVIGNNKKETGDLNPDDSKQMVEAAAAPVQQVASAAPVVNAAGANANSRQTQAYLNQAQNPNNDPIQNTLALSQAKLNAMKPGGATVAQQQQIQQVQQQQNAEAVDKTAAAVGQLLTVLLAPKQQAPVETQDEINARVAKEVREEGEKRGDVYDADGKLVSTVASRELDDYDAAHADEYQNNYIRLGRYNHDLKIRVTRDSVKKWNNTASQKECMDFIASNIWKYADPPSKRWAEEYVEEVSFIDSTFRYSTNYDDPLHPRHGLYTTGYKLNFNMTPITDFSITPRDKTFDYIILNVNTDSKDEKLRFCLSIDAVDDDTPYKLIKAFTRLIILSHGKIAAQ
jgi:hypothetical protein